MTFPPNKNNSYYETFDGVHKGHETIINRINQIAEKTLSSVLLTFDL